MSWSIDIKASTDIKESDIDDIVNKLPKELKGQLGSSKQSWGWSCVTDISVPKGKSFYISGASYSEQYALSMAQHFKCQLYKKGYRYIKLGELL